jgi:hypothetical protein
MRNNLETAQFSAKPPSLDKPNPYALLCLPNQSPNQTPQYHIKQGNERENTKSKEKYNNLEI